MITIWTGKPDLVMDGHHVALHVSRVVGRVGTVSAYISSWPAFNTGYPRELGFENASFVPSDWLEAGSVLLEFKEMFLLEKRMNFGVNNSEIKEIFL